MNKGQNSKHRVTGAKCRAARSKSLRIWKGPDLLCDSRRNKPTTGAVYIVQEWDDKTATVKLHPDYAGNNATADSAPTETLETHCAEYQERGSTHDAK